MVNSYLFFLVSTFYMKLLLIEKIKVYSTNNLIFIIFFIFINMSILNKLASTCY